MEKKIPLSGASTFPCCPPVTVSGWLSCLLPEGSHSVILTVLMISARSVWSLLCDMDSLNPSSNCMKTTLIVPVLKMRKLTCCVCEIFQGHTVGKQQSWDSEVLEFLGLSFHLGFHSDYTMQLEETSTEQSSCVEAVKVLWKGVNCSVRQCWGEGGRQSNRSQEQPVNTVCHQLSCRRWLLPSDMYINLSLMSGYNLVMPVTSRLTIFYNFIISFLL